VAAIKQKQKKWRPRVPFVRLPNDFYRDLKDDVEKRNKEEEGEQPSRIDMGFDGISPLFWYEAWAEEGILAEPGVRMRSVAVYRRMVPGGGEAEASFYVPTSSSSSSSSSGGMPWNSNSNESQTTGKSMELPSGDSKLASRERRERAKAMDRLGEVEQRAEREWEEGKARWMEEMSDPNRASLYEADDDDSEYDEFDVGMEIGEVTVAGDAAYSAPWSERGVDADVIASSNQKEESLPDGESSDLMIGKEQLQSASVEKEPSQSDATKILKQLDPKPRRDLPSIEDNPVFQRLWKGQSQVTSKGQNTAVALDGTPTDAEAPLPPYPSDPHFVGAWRVVQSPLGMEPNAFMEEDTESQSSDNFILRVDGQVMGGPVLDAQNQHKAAGGEWKMFQAVRKSSTKSDAPPVTQTRLRIRLLVPPTKEKALVMEGEVTRLVVPGGTSGDDAASSEGWRMASGGMLDGMLQNLEDVPSQSSSGKGDGMLYCGGEAWLEDAERGGSRKKVGPFSLMKLKAIDRKNLIYTVDVSRPKPEGDGGDDEEAKDD